MNGGPTLGPGAEAAEERVFAWVRGRAGTLAERVRRHPFAFDTLVALVIALASLVGLVVQHRLHHGDTIVFCAALCAPLMLRAWDRRLSFVLTALVAVAQWLTSTPQIADGAVLVALFWVALDSRLPEVAAAAVITEVGAIIAALHWSPEDAAKVWVGLSGLAVAAGSIGLVLRERRALVQSLHERAARLEFERDQEGRLGAAAERARIAREMHDIVSHNLTVMIGLADGATYALESSPEASLSAMRQVSANGRQALGEMRRLLGVLHDDDPEQAAFEPQPGLDRLDELLARVEAAGIPVAIAVDGDPHQLSRGMQLTVFRVAQEALTNTLRHAARPATARLSLRCGGDRVELEVTDTGAARPRPASGSAHIGRGLRGMRERAAAYGGSVEAGPRPEGGWRVRLVLASERQGVTS